MDISQMEFFQVYNIIPSISSITGISPQRYLWRICIALHISPRLIVSCSSFAAHPKVGSVEFYFIILFLCFRLHSCIEIISIITS